MASFEKLEEIDPVLHLTLNNFKTLTKEGFDVLDLKFKVAINLASEGVINFNLHGEEEFKVTEDKAGRFVSKHAELLLSIIIKKQFEAIREGLYSVINRDILIHFDPNELEKNIIGFDGLNAQDVNSTSTYNEYDENSPIDDYFWDVFESFNKKNVKGIVAVYHWT